MPATNGSASLATAENDRAPLLKPNGNAPAYGTANGGETNGDVEAAAPEQEEHQGMPELMKKLPVLFPAVGIGIFLAAADQTIVVSSYGRIGSELKALSSTSWIATAYFLTLTSIQPLYGKLSDIFGRKSCLLFAYTIFGIGCLLCGLARNIQELVAARAFAGIGGAGMTTVVSILFSDIIPLRDRGLWQGYINIVFAAGAGSGAPLGGLFVDVIGWRWAFLSQAPLCLVAIIAVYFVLDLPQIEDSHWKQKLRQIDFLGALTLVAAVLNLLVGLHYGSNVSWSSKIAIVTLSLSVPLFALFVFVEMKVASHPFAPGHIIFERSLFASYCCNFFAFAAYMSTLFYVPLVFQAVDGLSATQAGVRLIPPIIASVSGSVSAGVVMRKTGKFYKLTIFAYSCLFCGHIPILLCSGLVTNSTPAIVIGIMFCGFGGGIGVTSTLISLIANADREDQAVATACSYLFRSLGSVVGIAVTGSVVQDTLRTSLRASLPNGEEADEIVRRVQESLEYIRFLEPGVRDLVRACYQQATNRAFALCLAISAGAVVASFFIREKQLVKKK